MPVFRTRTQALAVEWLASSAYMCDGGRLSNPRLMALMSTSLLAGRTWSVRMCGNSSASMSRSSMSFKSRFLMPFLLTLCAV